MRGTDITGTMKKYWLRPYWQTDALDAWLSAQEASGWRLVSSTHFRRLIFQAAEPKHTQWFMTFGEKAEHMFDAESWLKKTKNADEIAMPVLIPGIFGWENAYRVPAPIGEGDLLVRQIPSDVRESEAEATLSEIAGHLQSGRIDTPAGLREAALHTIACKAAIKGGWQTDPVELKRLAAEVLSRDDLKYCPHGRPICVVLTRRQLEKQFKRIT